MATLLESVCRSMTYDQKMIVEGIVRELKPLNEVELTPDQINQIFQGAQGGATAAGGNRTALGQSKDAIAFVNDTINKAGKWVQDTRPVQWADKKIEAAQAKGAQKFPELAKTLNTLGAWAKENPKKTAAVIGIMTAIASLAAGPSGAFIAGQILRGTAEILKGEKLSTAVGKGLKAGAYGFLAGMGLKELGEYLGAVKVVAEEIPGYNALTKIKLYRSGTGQPFRFIDGTIPTKLVPKVDHLIKLADEAFRRGDINGGLRQWQVVKGMVESPEMVKAMDVLRDQNTKLYADAVKHAKNMATAIDGITAAVKGAIQATAGSSSNTDTKPAPTAESIDHVLTEYRQEFNESIGLPRGGVHLTEAGVMNAFKQAAGKAGQWAQTKGQNLTTKVTADKLKSAWAKAGSPTDSEAIEKILQQSGIKPEVITSVFKSLNIPTTTPDSAPTADAGTSGTSDTSAATTSGPSGSLRPSSPVDDNLGVLGSLKQGALNILEPGGKERLKNWYWDTLNSPKVYQQNLQKFKTEVQGKLKSLQGGQQGGGTVYTPEPRVPGQLTPAQQAQQTAVQQMKATQAANVQKSQDDEQIRANYRAAMAKPGFNRTATDNLAIKNGQARGIKEDKKYNLFNQILEAKIRKINEDQQSAIPLIYDAAGKYIQGLPQDGEYAKYKTALEQSVAAAGTEFDKNKKLSDATLKNVFDIIWQWAIKAHKTEQRKVTTGEKPRYSSEQPGTNQSAQLDDRQLNQFFKTFKDKYSGKLEDSAKESYKRPLIARLTPVVKSIKSSLTAEGVRANTIPRVTDWKQLEADLSEIGWDMSNSDNKLKFLKFLENLLKTFED